MESNEIEVTFNLDEGMIATVMIVPLPNESQKETEFRALKKLYNQVEMVAGLAGIDIGR